GEAEEPFLENRVDAVPQRQRQAEEPAVVTEPGQPVLAPAVDARARLVVAEVAPGVAKRAVVLAHRSPLALAQIRPPFAPRHPLFAARHQTLRLGIVRHASPLAQETWCPLPHRGFVRTSSLGGRRSAAPWPRASAAGGTIGI